MAEEWIQAEFDKERRVTYQKIYNQTGWTNVVGLAFSGIYAIAGPIYACAVVFNNFPRVKGLQSAKKLNKIECESIAQTIKEKENILWEFGLSAACQAMTFGNKQATFVAALAALTNIGFITKYDLIIAEPFEWNVLPPYGFARVPVIKSHKAAELCDLVGVASILARAARDQFMISLNNRYPGFYWDTNTGHSTSQHLEAIKTLGITPEHRGLDSLKSLKGTIFKPYRGLNNG